MRSCILQKILEEDDWEDEDVKDSGVWSSMIEKLQVQRQGDKIKSLLRTQLIKFAPSGNDPERQKETISFDESIASGQLDWQFHDPNNEWYHPFWQTNSDNRDCRENTNDSPSNDFIAGVGTEADFGGTEAEDEVKDKIKEIMKEIF